MQNLLKEPLNKNSQVIISHIESSRKIDNDLEVKAEQLWNEELARAASQGKKLWDSKLYRVENISTDADNNLNIAFSQINYSIRKSLSKFTDDITRLGLDYSASGCFSSIFVKTKDNKLLFIEKSSKYVTSKKNSFVGGIMSVDEMDINNVADLFFSAEKEIEEELGVPISHIVSDDLVAVFRNANYNYCFLYSTLLDLTFDEVVQKFNENNDGEASAVIGIPVDEIEKIESLLDEDDCKKFKEYMHFIV